MKLTFLGGAGTVTGSKTLIETGAGRVLVDCGLFQGVKNLRLRNRQALPFEPSELAAVVLTHAHLDHSGFLPSLVREGFQGPVFCSPLTASLCEILLPDAGHLQEEDARYANRKGFSRHHPALPLYTEEDAELALRQLSPIGFEHVEQIAGLRFRLQPAGHILGAASVEIGRDGRHVLFSGDLGRPQDLLMEPPAPPGEADWIVIESTYGDRRHPDSDPFEALASAIERTVGRGGVLLIPSFAVGRTQTLLYCLYEIFRRGLAPKVPVYVNSPMATNVTDLFRQAHAHHRLSEKTSEAVCDVARYVRSTDESRRLSASREPAVIISASGMASGGRVLHHLRALAPDRRNTILFAGFQAPGTRGDALVHGAREIKIHGRYVPVQAEVVQLDIFSAHADAEELLGWLGAATRAPRRVFVNHGEPAPADALRRSIRDRLGWDAVVAEHGDSVVLD